METKIHQIQTKENKVRDQYELKVMSFLKQPVESRSPVLQNEIVHLSSLLRGYEEQLYALRRSYDDKRQLNFINDIGEFDFSCEQIEQLMESDKILLDRYRAIDLNETLRKYFDNNSQKFTKILKQFVQKRNAYRKTPKSTLLQELVFLKSNLIWHLCVLETLTKPLMSC